MMSLEQVNEGDTRRCNAMEGNALSDVSPGEATERAPRGPAELIPTRDSLLSRLKEGGQEDSWRDFFETYWRLIYQTGRKYGLTDSEAQDVVQETMIELSQRIGDFQRDQKRGSFKAWLMRLTQWKIVDQIRSRSPAERLDSDFGEETDARFVDDWDRNWQVNAAEEAVRRVQSSARPKMFQAYSLCVLQGRSHLAAGKLLRMSVPAVYMAIFRIRRQLRRELEKLQKGQLCK
jgi:RNA polymerase sigma factor (sigma-70 family)